MATQSGARRGGAIVGTIAIYGEDIEPNVAHLRWFIVADGLRGAGVGGALMQATMDFVDSHGFAQTRLWSYSVLDAARALYERAGFRLVAEKPGLIGWPTITIANSTHNRN